MYARITPTRADPSKVEEVIRFTNEVLIPATRGLPGYRGIYATVDRGSGRGNAITLWDTREQAEGFRAALAGPMLQNIQDLGVQFEPSQVQEVVAQA